MHAKRVQRKGNEQVTNSLITSTHSLITHFQKIMPERPLQKDERFSNKTDGFNILGVNSDLDAIALWLDRSSRSPQTQRSYELEATRLILWATLKAQKPISQLTQVDMQSYQEFLLTPDDAWCGPKVKKKLTDNTLNLQWRPFVGPMSYPSSNRAMRVINSLFSFLVKGKYLEANPVDTLNFGHPGSMGDTDEVVSNAIEQALDALEWDCVIKTTESMPKDKKYLRAEYERTRFILLAFYTLGARIGELEKHRMGHFRLKNDRWHWYLKGKGGKYASVPVSDFMVDAMTQYRRFLGLSDMPSPGDQTPFFMNRAGTKAISARRVFDLLKKLFISASELFTQLYPEKPNKLSKATPHWLRHTMATHLSNQTTDMRIVMSILRHSDINTTMIYSHVDSDKQFDLLNKLMKKDSTFS